MAADWLTVPPVVFLIWNLKDVVLSRRISAKRPPTWTTLTVSLAPIPELLTVKKSEALAVLLALYEVASSGVVSSTLVKLLVEPAVPPATVSQPLESPAALGRTSTMLPAPGNPVWLPPVCSSLTATSSMLKLTVAVSIAPIRRVLEGRLVLAVPLANWTPSIELVVAPVA